MKKLKKIILTGTLVVAITATSATAFAATNYKTPAQIVAELTGRTQDSITDEKVETGKTYGTIASEAGKLDAFKNEKLKARKAYLDEQVKAGTITKEKADAIIKAMEDNQAICDGTGNAGLGKHSGCGLGSGIGGGNRGTSGRGMHLRDGSCYSQAE